MQDVQSNEETIDTSWFDHLLQRISQVDIKCPIYFEWIKDMNLKLR
jgi:hypothetical protein